MLGDKYTRRNRLAAMLEAQDAAAPPIKSHMQGLSKMLRMGLAGYNRRKDAEDRKAAMTAIMAGANPQFAADTPARYATDFSTEMEPGTGPGQQIAGTGGIGGMLTAAQGLPENEYARNLAQMLAMKKIGQDYSAEQEALKRTQGMEAYRYQQLYKVFPPQRPLRPKIVTTAEGVFIQNEDGSLGARLGTPAAAIQFTVSGGEDPPVSQDGAPIGAFGVPVAKVDPTAGLPRKQAADLKVQIRQAAMTNFAKGQKALDQAKNVSARLDRFIELIDGGMGTGSEYKIPGVTTVVSAFSADVAEAQSIVDMMTPMMRQGMPGAASDRDVAMFRGATVGLDKPEQANRNIAAALSESRKNLIARTEFMRAYFNQNQHLQGADAEWKKYLEANPIFDPKAVQSKRYSPNPNRKTWQEFFGSANPVAESGFTLKKITPGSR